MRYVLARLKKEQDAFAYRIYVTDALRLISENTGKAVYDGHMISKRYYDVVKGNKKESEETADDVIERMKNKMNGGS